MSIWAGLEEDVGGLLRLHESLGRVLSRSN